MGDATVRRDLATASDDAVEPVTIKSLDGKDRTYTPKPAHDAEAWERHLEHVDACRELRDEQATWQPPTPRVGLTPDPQPQAAQQPLTPPDLPTQQRPRSTPPPPIPIRPPEEVFYVRDDGSEVRVVDSWPAYVPRGVDQMELPAEELACPGVRLLLLDDGSWTYKCEHCARPFATPNRDHHLRCRQQRRGSHRGSRGMAQTIHINARIG